MITLILVALALLLVVFLAVAALRPADFRIVRSIAINAPAGAVFPYLNDLRLWQEFSPWAKLDPQVQNTYTGPAAGVGASLSWSGNAKIGQGSMTIIESVPGELVRMNLVFIRPFPANNLAEFTLQSAGDQTSITWSMTGRYNFIARAVGLFMNMEKLVGGDFARGLATLKTLAEASKRP